MSEEPKSIWKKSWTGWNWLWAWLIIAAATFLVFLVISFFMPGGPRHLFDGFLAALFLSSISTIVAAIFVGLWCFIRWMFSPKNLRRSLFAFACLVTLIALAYAEEDWRGWHAWNQFKHEWEAKGEKFDWQSVVPPPVPDDQNFAFSPVWMAEVRYNFLNTPKRAEVWYGNRIYSDEVSKILSLLPVSDSALVGTNWAYQLPPTPQTSGNWAAGRMTDLKPWQTYYRDFEKTNPKAEIPIAPQPQSPAQDVLLALSKFDPVFEQLRRDSVRPYSRFPIGYDDENKASILIPHLASLKRHTQVLQLRAIAELQDGQSEQALDDMKLMLRLTDALRTEPFWISQLVRLSMVEITLQPIWEGLSEHRWSESQLVVLGEDLAKLDLLADWRNVMISETAFSAEEADYLRRHRDYVTQFAQMGIRYPDNHQFEFAIFRFMPGGWFYQSALKNGRTLMQYLPAVNHDAETISPSLIQQADVATSKAVSLFDPLDSLKLSFNSEFLLAGNFVKKIAVGQSSVDMARTAIALERYRLAHGGYPESLDALAPQFIAKVPHDIIGGGPLHYRLTSDGQFVLYSLGWNETDDGGVVVFHKGSTQSVNIDEGDWVWKYPQK